MWRLWLYLQPGDLKGLLFVLMVVAAMVYLLGSYSIFPGYARQMWLERRHESSWNCSIAPHGVCIETRNEFKSADTPP